MIMGLAGRKQSGKSTGAGFMEDLGFERLSFAEPLKLLVDLLLIDLDIDVETIADHARHKERIIPEIGCSYRYLCQTLGTEWGRNLVHPDLWVKLARTKLSKLRADKHVVFDDVRMENEAAMIRELGGVIIHVRRGDAEPVDRHSSEAGILVRPGDEVLLNHLDLEHYQRELLEVVRVALPLS